MYNIFLTPYWIYKIISFNYFSSCKDDILDIRYVKSFSRYKWIVLNTNHNLKILPNEGAIENGINRSILINCLFGRCSFSGPKCRKWTPSQEEHKTFRASLVHFDTKSHHPDQSRPPLFSLDSTFKNYFEKAKLALKPSRALPTHYTDISLYTLEIYSGSVLGTVVPKNKSHSVLETGKLLKLERCLERIKLVQR